MFAYATLALICLSFSFVNLGLKTLFGLKRQKNFKTLQLAPPMSLNCGDRFLSQMESALCCASLYSYKCNVWFCILIVCPASHSALMRIHCCLQLHVCCYRWVGKPKEASLGIPTLVYLCTAFPVTPYAKPHTPS
jgi:hypothetical protein